MTDPGFQPANPLEELLVRATYDARERDAFLRALRETTLYALAPALPEGVEESEVSADAPVQLITWWDGEEPVVPIFTSAARIDEATGGAGGEFSCIEVPGGALLALLAQGGTAVGLNPNCSYGRRFTVAELRALADMV